MRRLRCGVPRRRGDEPVADPRTDCSSMRVPRRRGDEPAASIGFAAAMRSVPRRRGDEPLLARWSVIAHDVFPAGAGMNRDMHD